MTPNDKENSNASPIQRLGLRSSTVVAHVDRAATSGLRQSFQVVLRTIHVKLSDVGGAGAGAKPNAARRYSTCEMVGR